MYEAETASSSLERANAVHEQAMARASEAASAALTRERDRTAAVRAAGQKALEEQGRVVEAAEVALKAAQEKAMRAIWGMRAAQEDGDALRARVEQLEGQVRELQADLERATASNTVIVAGSGPGDAAAAATAALAAAREKARSAAEVADGLRSKLADAVRARDEAQRAMSRLAAERKADWDAAMAAARAEVAMQQQQHQQQHNHQPALPDAGFSLDDADGSGYYQEPSGEGSNTTPWGSSAVRRSGAGTMGSPSATGRDHHLQPPGNGDARSRSLGDSSPRRRLHLGPIASLPEENHSSDSGAAGVALEQQQFNSAHAPLRASGPSAAETSAQRSAGAARAATEASAALAAAEEALATQRARAGALLAAATQHEPPSALRLAAMALAAAVAHEEGQH